MFRRAGSGLLLAVVVFSLLGASSAMASTTTSLKTVHYGGDSFRNFDFDSQRASAGNVDWPVDLVFWGNASVDKVYAGIGWSLAGSNEYGRLNDGTGAIWVPSAGRKSGLCSGTHFRLYAPPVGYLSNRKLGHYVIATAHVDKNECFGSAQYGWNRRPRRPRIPGGCGVGSRERSGECDADARRHHVHVLAVRQRSERAAGEPLLRQQRTSDADPRALAMIAARRPVTMLGGVAWHRTRRTLRHSSTSGSASWATGAARR